MGKLLGYGPMKSAFARESEASSPIHEAFDTLNFVVKPFYHSLAPEAADAGEHGLIIIADAGGKTDQFGNAVTEPLNFDTRSDLHSK